MRRIPISALLLGLQLALLGCATPGKRPPALAEHVRARLATIAVEPSHALPSVHFELPPTGAAGALEGAKAGALVGSYPGQALMQTQLALFGIPIAAAGAIVGGLSGSLYGALVAEPEAAIANAAATLQEAVAALDVQEALADHVLRQARAASTYCFMRRPSAASAGGVLTAEPEGVESVLETHVSAFGLERLGIGLTPRLSMFLHVRVRLRTPNLDGASYDQMFEITQGAEDYTAWIADGSKLFLEALSEGYQSLAEEIVHELFLLHPMTHPRRGSWVAVPYLFTGPLPIAPEVLQPWLGSHPLETLEVDSLQPVLQWQAFPPAQDPVREYGRGRWSEVTYDLKVWHAEGWPSFRPDRLVYARDGLVSPTHRIETPLQPSREYVWSIRAHFLLDGHARATPWSSYKVPADPERVHSYRFETPDD